MLQGVASRYERNQRLTKSYQSLHATRAQHRASCFVLGLSLGIMVRREQKITLGEMRSSGPRRLLVYCADYRCAHHVEIDAQRWPDDVRLSDLEPLFVCQVCGHRGADVRPLFEPARMGTGG